MDIRQLFPNLSDLEFDKEVALALGDIVIDIRSKLRGYSDLNPIQIFDKPSESVAQSMMRLGAIRLLTDNRIIYWNPDEDDESSDYTVTVVNRYELEKLFLRAKGLSNNEITQQLPNLVYYNPMDGRGIVNGRTIHLKPKSKRKAKELFDALCALAPNSLPRDRIKAILRLTAEYKISASFAAEEISAAFTNLRKRCGVDAQVIKLQKDGLLNAEVTLINKFPDFFIFPE